MRRRYTEHGEKMPVLTYPKTERRRQTADGSLQQTQAVREHLCCRLPSAVSSRWEKGQFVPVYGIAGRDNQIVSGMLVGFRRHYSNRPTVRRSITYLF